MRFPLLSLWLFFISARELKLHANRAVSYFQIGPGHCAAPLFETPHALLRRRVQIFTLMMSFCAIRNFRVYRSVRKSTLLKIQHSRRLFELNCGNWSRKWVVVFCF
jgi:hypothetical protein